MGLEEEVTVTQGTRRSVVGGVSPRRASRSLFSSPPRALLAPIALAGVILLAWWVAAVVADSSVFPTPTEAVTSLLVDLVNPRFQTSILTTVTVLVVAFAAAGLIGAVLGMLLGLSAFWSSSILPIIYSFNSIPKITLYPVFLMLLGIGDFSRGTFAFVSGVLPMFLLVAESTAAVSRLHLKLAASLRLGWARLLWHIVLPSIMPAIASGLRLTFGLTFLGLLLAEMFSGSSGLGYELVRNITLAKMGNIMGEVILIATMALVPTLFLQGLERQVRHRFGGDT
jgi:NitT/TauT family transport system permease protein